MIKGDNVAQELQLMVLERLYRFMTFFYMGSVGGEGRVLACTSRVVGAS